ncbi:MAG: hypothetical protein F4Y61_06625 [Rhodothermaceae bacterium]|nr:hypothetical protein [Rhodothermaceae bacterium]
MKVSRSVRRVYDDQKAINEQLKEVVDRRIMGLKHPRWHYEGRVKGLVSFALKIETGRCKQPAALEDFFACTVVVANTNELKQAEELICTHFTLKERRPRANKFIHKTPEMFPFDDLRLYVTAHDPSMPPTDLSEIVFEVQIKTFLQHAWAIATHDLVYKSDEVDWGKQRIASQLKAMLEHAEVSIEEANKLATSSVLSKENRKTRRIKDGIALLKSHWNQDELPSDMRRLAENIAALLKLLNLELPRLETILKNNKASRGGIHLKNLSPFGTVVQYLFNDEPKQMQQRLTDGNVSQKVLIPSEIDLPPNLDRETFTNALFVGVQ